MSVILALTLAIGCAKKWDGKSPLVLTNHTDISVSDCTVDLPGQTAITADNNCTITLVRCTIHADTAIDASNNVTLHLVDTVLVAKTVALSLENHVNVDAKGGRIEGGKLGMSISNNVHVALAGTTVVGAVKREIDSTIDGLPALEAEQAAERIANQFGSSVCDIAFGCYGAKFLGTLAGRFTVELDASGNVTAARYEGEAPDAARACLTSTADKHVAGFTGPPGKLECAYQGTIGPNSRRLDRSWTFVPNDAKH